MKISQAFIAEKLSLSVATISKSLRNDPEIHPRTRAQVVELASQLGYRAPGTRIDKPARRSQGVKSICLMLQSDSLLGAEVLRNASQVMEGISEAGHAADAVVSIHYVPLCDLEFVDRPEYQPVALREGMLSGLVLHHYYPPRIIEALAKLVPVVAISRSSTFDPIDGVDCDASQVMGLLVRYLAEQGHRRIGYLTGCVHHAWHQDRFGAFVQSMAMLGLPVDPAIAHGAYNDLDEHADRIAELTRQGVTAWVTGSDSIGYAWCKRLEARGIRVGRDVAIAGVDGIAPPEGCPRLTSVHLRFDEMGRAAVGLLLERMREPAAPLRRVCVQGSLIEGESTPLVSQIMARK